MKELIMWLILMIYAFSIIYKMFERTNVIKTIRIELTEEELSYLINDTIAYIWRIEGTSKSEKDLEERGYYSRKALLEKLEATEKEYLKDKGECKTDEH